jgi:hypothetical protein
MGMRSVVLLGLFSADVVHSHGMMNRPSPRNNRHNTPFHNLTGCAGNACYWYVKLTASCTDDRIHFLYVQWTRQSFVLVRRIAAFAGTRWAA